MQKSGYQNRTDYHWFVRPVKPIKAGLKAVTGRGVVIIDDGSWELIHMETSLK